MSENSENFKVLKEDCEKCLKNARCAFENKNYGEAERILSKVKVPNVKVRQLMIEVRHKINNKDVHEGDNDIKRNVKKVAHTTPVTREELQTKSEDVRVEERNYLNSLDNNGRETNRYSSEMVKNSDNNKLLYPGKGDAIIKDIFLSDDNKTNLKKTECLSKESSDLTSIKMVQEAQEKSTDLFSDKFITNHTVSEPNTKSIEKDNDKHINYRNLLRKNDHKRDKKEIIFDFTGKSSTMDETAKLLQISNEELHKNSNTVAVHKNDLINSDNIDKVFSSKKTDKNFNSNDIMNSKPLNNVIGDQFDKDISPTDDFKTTVTEIQVLSNKSTGNKAEQVMQNEGTDFFSNKVCEAHTKSVEKTKQSTKPKFCEKVNNTTVYDFRNKVNNVIPTSNDTKTSNKEELKKCAHVAKGVLLANPRNECINTTNTQRQTNIHLNRKENVDSNKQFIIESKPLTIDVKDEVLEDNFPANDFETNAIEVKGLSKESINKITIMPEKGTDLCSQVMTEKSTDLCSKNFKIGYTVDEANEKATEKESTQYIGSSFNNNSSTRKKDSEEANNNSDINSFKYEVKNPISIVSNQKSGSDDKPKNQIHVADEEFHTKSKIDSTNNRRETSRYSNGSVENSNNSNQLIRNTKSFNTGAEDETVKRNSTTDDFGQERTDEISDARAQVMQEEGTSLISKDSKIDYTEKGNEGIFTITEKSSSVDEPNYFSDTPCETAHAKSKTDDVEDKMSPANNRIETNINLIGISENSNINTQLIRNSKHCSTDVEDQIAQGNCPRDDFKINVQELGTLSKESTEEIALVTQKGGTASLLKDIKIDRRVDETNVNTIEKENAEQINSILHNVATEEIVIEVENPAIYDHDDEAKNTIPLTRDGKCSDKDQPYTEPELLQNNFNLRIKILLLEIQVRFKTEKFISPLSLTTRDEISKLVYEAQTAYFNGNKNEAYGLLLQGEKLSEKDPLKKFKNNSFDYKEDTFLKNTNNNDLSSSQSVYLPEEIVKGDSHEVSKCINIAQKALNEGYLEKAEKFLKKAQRMIPSEQAEKMLHEVETTIKANQAMQEAEKTKMENYGYSGQPNIENETGNDEKTEYLKADIDDTTILIMSDENMDENDPVKSIINSSSVCNEDGFQKKTDNDFVCLSESICVEKNRMDEKLEMSEKFPEKPRRTKAKNQDERMSENNHEKNAIKSSIYEEENNEPKYPNTDQNAIDENVGPVKFPVKIQRTKKKKPAQNQATQGENDYILEKSSKIQESENNLENQQPNNATDQQYKLVLKEMKTVIGSKRATQEAGKTKIDNNISSDLPTNPNEFSNVGHSTENSKEKINERDPVENIINTPPDEQSQLMYTTEKPVKEDNKDVSGQKKRNRIKRKAPAIPSKHELQITSENIPPNMPNTNKPEDREGSSLHQNTKINEDFESKLTSHAYSCDALSISSTGTAGSHLDKSIIDKSQQTKTSPPKSKKDQENSNREARVQIVKNKLENCSIV